MKTPAAFSAYVAERSVTHVVAYEFSGAVLQCLLEAGISAISIDRRVPEHDGPSFQGDAWDVLYLREWTMVFFIGPPCFQHLRGDIHCIRQKIEDGRAYWGGAEVIKCISFENARGVVVEQPDTLVFDFLDWGSLPDVAVLEFRTSWLGDASDKFIRLFTRNVILAELPAEHERPVVERQRRPMPRHDRCR